jgi:hypothetical protein
MNAEEDKAHIVQEATRDSKRLKGRRLVLSLFIICMVLLLLTAFLAYKLLYKPTQQQAQAGTDLATQVQAACDDPKQNTATLHNLCNDADEVVDSTPGTVKGEKGDPGTPGEPGPPPSDAQVANAVALYCATRSSCTGPKGNNATQAQVAEAVASYCNSNGECRGPAGAAGSAGQDGATGDQGERGEQGPGPSDAQVASAVAAYCSTRDNCQGPKGDTGAQGDPGPAGQAGQPGDTVDGGSCEFTGIGTLSITIQTSNGPTTFECVGNPAGGNAE